MNTPIALIIFNRPDLTERVFKEIARARPKQLFVIADGPRSEHPGDAEKCAAARAVIDLVDWDCQVLKNFSDVNLGVGLRPATGIRWVFDQVEQAIIFEDDCLPHPTFFRYCEELLEKYRDDERIMHISGDNWHFSQTSWSYFFSRYCYSCGWASWRRAFKYYDPTIQLWPALRDTSWLLDIVGDPNIVEFWKTNFDRVYRTGIKRCGWDWPWLFACWVHHGLSVLPGTNLVSNIGFRQDASSSKNPNDKRANVPTTAMDFPLRHPPCMIRDTDADRQIVEQFGVKPRRENMYQQLRRTCVAALPRSLRELLRTFRSSMVLKKSSTIW